METEYCVDRPRILRSMEAIEIQTLESYCWASLQFVWNHLPVTSELMKGPLEWELRTPTIVVRTFASNLTRGRSVNLAGASGPLVHI
jgi:hypothetical protein